MNSCVRQGTAKALPYLILASIALGTGIGAGTAQAQELGGSVALAEAHRGDFDLRIGTDGQLTVKNRYTGLTATIPTTAPAGARATSAARGGSYDELITEHARRNNLRPDLVRAVVQVESGFNPYARSPKGAQGLMQLMPETARQFNVSNPYDPEQNIRAGSSYLRQLLDRYDNNEQLALAAYNAGPGAVDKYRQTVPPYRETKQYVTKVTQIAGDVTDGDGPTVVPSPSKTKFYRIVQIIDGHEVTTYATSKPQR